MLLSSTQSVGVIFKFENFESVWMARSISVINSLETKTWFFTGKIAPFSIVTPSSIGAPSKLSSSGKLPACVEDILPLPLPIVG